MAVNPNPYVCVRVTLRNLLGATAAAVKPSRNVRSAAKAQVRELGRGGIAVPARAGKAPGEVIPASAPGDPLVRFVVDVSAPLPDATDHIEEAEGAPAF